MVELFFCPNELLYYGFKLSFSKIEEKEAFPCPKNYQMKIKKRY